MLAALINIPKRLSLHRKTSCYWEGFQCYQTRQPCKYAPESKEADQWAAGFAYAVNVDAGAKVWYKSKTVRVAGAITVIGLILFGFGYWSAPGQAGSTMMGAGGGITLQSLLMVLLRTVSNEAITWGNNQPPNSTWGK